MKMITDYLPDGKKTNRHILIGLVQARAVRSVSTEDASQMHMVISPSVQA